MMKRTLCVVGALLIFVVSAFGISAYAAARPIATDANQDGVFNDDDLSEIMDILLDASEMSQLDANFDGNFDIRDTVALQKALIGLDWNDNFVSDNDFGI